MSRTTTIPLDSLLVPWLEADGDEAAEQRLTQLIRAEIEPVIRGVIRFKLRLDASSSEVADLKQEAVAEVLEALNKCRAAANHSPIGDVRALAATITYRACYRWLRRQSPQRNALRNRLQYVLTHKPRLALWPDLLKHWLSGLAEWRGRSDRMAADDLQRLREDERLWVWAGRTHCVSAFSDFLEALFTRAGLPIDLDELTQLAATLLGVRDAAPVSMTAGGGTEIGLLARDDVAWLVEKRIFLKRLWEELQQLPLPQRTALLLNLRDAMGQGCIALFPALGVASLRQLAIALEMPLERLTELWNQLPLDDANIGALLKLTRQQVINARKAGRERLARRLRGFF